MVTPQSLADVGKNWDLDVSLDVVREHRRANKDAHRFKIAATVLGAIAVGVGGLGGWGLAYGDFSPVGGFWTAAGPILGTVIGFYFGKAGDDP